MRINLLLALTLSSISIATVTQAQDYQAPNQQAAQLTAQRPIRRIPGQLRPIPQLREPRNVSPELLGRQAMRDGNYRLAESKFREVLQDGHAESYRIYTYLGLSIYNQAIGNEIVLGRDYHRLPPPHIGGAISAFTEALKLEPTHNEALEGLAKSYEYRADSVFEQSLEKAIADYQLAKETLGEITPRFVRVSDSRRLSSVESLERSITSKLARAYVKRGDRQETRNLEGALQDYQLAFDSLGLRPAVRSIEFCSKFRAWNLNTSPSRRRRASTIFVPPNLNANPSRRRRASTIFVPPNLNANPSRSRRLATNSTLITEIRNKLAKALTLRGDRSNASADYCEAIRINSEYAPAYFKLGHIFSEQGNQSEAIVKYQEAIDANNQYLEAYVALAGAFEMQNEHDKADETYVRLFKIAPDTADIESKLPREQLEALAAYFYRQLRVDSNNAHHHYYHLGRISSWQEDFEGAIENYEKSLSITDSGRIIFKNRRYDAYRLRGLALSAQGKYQQAIESLETAIRRRPDDATGHYDLGKVLVKQGTDLHRARASYRKAINLNENYAEAYNALGQLWAMNNIREDDQKAASYFLTAIEKDNNYAEPRNNLGQLYQRYKLFDQAIYYYNEALNISAHDYSEARNNLTNAESQLKELLSSEDYPRGPTGDTDWFWLNWDDDDASSTLKRSVVRIVPRQGGGAGTGWVVHRENNSLWIVTNRHVIGEVGEIDVQFFSNRPPKRDYLKLPATPVQISPDIDLALLKVDGAPPNIAPLTIARESLSSFSAVRIVGHPEISDEWTIVDGSASRNNSQTDPYSFVDGNHLQIDATVGTGNSGGPVINDKNQVVGVMHAATNGVIKVGSNGVVEVNDIAATGGFGGAYSVSALRNVLDSWDIHIP